jgi:hypothetical protein
MPLPPHVTVALRWEHMTNEFNSVLYYTQESGDPIDASNIEQLADAFSAVWTARAEVLVNPDCRYLGVKVRYLTPTIDLEAYSTEDPQIGTAVSDDVEPEEVAVVIQRRTSKPGRNKRGRVFIPLVPSDYLEGSAIVASASVFYNQFAAEMKDTQVFSTPPGTWVACTPDWKNSLLEPVTQCRVDSEVKSRRDRREPKRSLILNG